MINKTLRILIADPQHFHRMKIERMFNRLDYYRIAPVQSLDELLMLIDYSCEPFDGVVVNADLAANRLNLHEFLLDSLHVRHALIYNDPVCGPLQDNVHASRAALPSVCAIERLMAAVEHSASSGACAPLSQWRTQAQFG
ncbi:chemotaxis protein CheY [Pseudomonas botevensis]|uniref:chemotaxis protein CheY n=1 Tax=Pseudomonas botevensis TaxID=2842352 RepID=UPI001C3D58DE|nr:chemotaxis protein CheY [Pseudomonas botevensis]MBV4474168.1 chemotaxis protein CheY [Pseudomonas botevensis]